MDVTAWALYLLIAATAIIGAWIHYRRREPAGRGRWLLAGSRGVVIAVLILLLFNPMVPTVRTGDTSVVALVDGSLSMAMPDSTGETAWTRARTAAAEVDADLLVLFGAGSGRGTTTLPDAAPGQPGSRLGPALRAALEAGADGIVVLTDGAVEDPVEVRRVLDDAPAIGVRRVGGQRAFNAGVVEVRAPDWTRVGEETQIGVTVGRIGTDAPDTVEVSLRRGAREVARRRVATPPVGREATVELPFTPREAASEPVRLDVALVTGGGSMPDDDRRAVYVGIAEEPPGAAVVSLAPDQEPRFLIPVLERASGLPVQGWLSVAEGRWARADAGSRAGRLEGTDAPRRALADADLVVVHGLDADAPRWVVEAVVRADRVLVFPADGAPGLPFQPGPARAGDWYVSDDLPASPVASLLAGVETDGLPPLTALRTPSPEGFWAPLTVQLGRRGEERAALAAGGVDGRRVVVALGDGYWRWAFASDAGRALYDRLWSAMIGWLVDVEGSTAGAAIRPVDRVVERGAAIRWRVPDDRDSARVRLVAADPVSDTAVGGAVVERTLAAEEGLVALPGVAPGHYRYTVEAGATGAGGVTVSSYSPEFTRLALLEERPERAAGVVGGGAAGARPFRSVPWGYVLVVLVVSVEWVLRRRWGLR